MVTIDVGREVLDQIEEAIRRSGYTGFLKLRLAEEPTVTTASVLDHARALDPRRCSLAVAIGLAADRRNAECPEPPGASHLPV